MYDKGLNIAMISEPTVDGVFRHVVGLTEFLLEQGHRVHFAYSDRRSCSQLTEFLALVTRAGGEILNLRISNAPEWNDLGAALRLRRWLRRLDPDVIHGHSSKGGALARLLAGTSASVFYTPNAYFGMAKKTSLKTFFYNSVERELGRIGTTINVSRDEAQFAAEQLGIPERKRLLIRNGVDTGRFAPPSPELRRAARTAFGIPEDAVVLGTIGRLTFQKYPQLLYRALAATLQGGSSVRLLHVGQGGLATEIDDLIAQYQLEPVVIRRSYLENPISFYHAVDAFILPSRFEGLPFVVLEALSCGLPLILSRCPGMNDFASFGLSHFWSAASEQQDEFVDAIRDWLADRQNRRPCNHRKIAEEHLDLRICYNQVLNAYQNAAAPLEPSAKLAPVDP
jgi:glycosyltransferase involved in cell wall biosynthesis